jgi:hypothetical protein
MKAVHVMTWLTLALRLFLFVIVYSLVTPRVRAITRRAESQSSTSDGASNVKPMTPPDKPTDSGWITVFLALAFIVGAGVATGVAVWIAPSEARLIVALWLSGAASLGLLSGYTTGVSTENGTASEFLKFISGGVFVPLLGAVGVLVSSQRDTERQSLEKVTEASAPAAFFPLAVLGGFLAFYSFFAMAGIILGVWHRSRGVWIKMQE